MKRLLSDTVYRYAYLPIISAWLFTFSFIFSNYISLSTSPGGVQRTLQQHLQRQELALANIITDTALLERMSGGQIRESDMNRLVSLDLGVFLYRLSEGGVPELRFWNTQGIQPTGQLLMSEDDEAFVSLRNGQYEFIRRRLMIQGSRDWMICALVPVRIDYFVENDYLPKGFVGAAGVEEHYRISSSIKDMAIRSIDGRVVYRIEKKGGSSQDGGGWVVMFMRLLGVLLFFFYLHMVALGVHRYQGPVSAILFLVTALFIFRLVSYSIPASSLFGIYDVFDPEVFNSGPISRSLGDMLVNSLLFLWVMLFVQSYAVQGVFATGGLHQGWRGVILSVLSALLLVTVTSLAGDSIRTLVSDSAISYDVTDFFRMDQYTVTGFFAIVCLSMGYFILTQMLFRLFPMGKGLSVYRGLLITAAAGLFFLVTFIDSPIRAFGLALLIWLIIYQMISIWSWRASENRIIGQGLVLWLLFFSVSIAAVIYSENRMREMVIRKLAAEKIALQTDPTGGYLVNIASLGISNDHILKSLPRFRDAVQSQELKDSIIYANFSGYKNRFGTRLFLFDAEGKPMSASDDLAHDTLQLIYTIQGRPTSVPNLRYYESNVTSFSYISRREIRDSTDSLRAVMFMVSHPRRFHDESLYPELIRSSGEYGLDKQMGYAYAVYDSLQLRYSRNDYTFPLRISQQQIPIDAFAWKVENDHDVLWYRPDGDTVILITRRVNFILESITLFAYIFCATLLLVAIFQFASFMVRTRFDIHAMLRVVRNLSIRRQIHSTIIMFSLFSFLVIGSVTIFFFIDRYERRNREMLGRTLQSVTEDLSYRLETLDIAYDVMSDSSGFNMATMDALVEGISQAHSIDINVYGPEGLLLASSQPYIYQEGILSRIMNPLAYWELKGQEKLQFVQMEKFGTLNYLSIYRPLRIQGKSAPVFVNIPYFASDQELKQEISGFLVALINLNTFVFLIAGVISVLITNRITSSLTWIGRKMQDLNIRDRNEEIQWGRKDEIGELVNQYNTMVRKLEDSVSALAAREREGAWRQMARQVAHEIKNPLTPMKLSIQYLQKSIDRNAPDVRELSQRMAATLIEQIEHLSKIAGDFAEFANIGNAHMETFDLRHVIQSVISLHGMSQRVEIVSQLQEAPIMMDADKTQMNRVLNNLLRNAIESIPKDRPGIIRVSAFVKHGHVELSVQDNGSGIPESTRPRIFMPNFTTKSSGTGLGLAICRSIVEHAGGRIWFETVTGAGTTFYISMPLYGSGETLATG